MQDYLINWNAGPLGVVLRPDLGLDMPPVVSQLLPQPSVLRMSGVRAGDLLISVNGKKTAKLGYDKVVKLLFKERLPIVLHFRVPSGGYADVEASAASHAPEADAGPLRGLPTPPPPAPSTPALPSERFADAAARTRPRGASSAALGVPGDFVDLPALARVQSQPQPQRYPHHDQYGDPQYGDPQFGDPHFGDPQFADPRYADLRFADPRYADPRFADHRHAGPRFADPQYPGPVLIRRQSADSAPPPHAGGVPVPVRGRRQSVDSAPRHRRVASPGSSGPPGQPSPSPSDPSDRPRAKTAAKTAAKAKAKAKDRAAAEERRLRKQYSVVWERGSLGFSFRAFASNVDVPTVDFIGAARGQGRGMDRVCVNDVLIAVNGEKTKHMGVEKVLRWLHVVDKPVVLRFHSSSNRIPSNPVPQVANAPSLPQGPQGTGDAAPRPHPPTRRNTRTQPAEAHGPRADRRLVDADLDADDADEGDDGEFEQLYPQPELQPQPQPPQPQRRASADGPRLPQRQLDASMHAYIARAHDNSLGRSHVSDGSVDAVGDFRREQQRPDEPPPGLHEFDLRIDARVVPRERTGRDEDGEDEPRVRRRSHSSHQHHVAFDPPASPDSHAHVGWDADRSPPPQPQLQPQQLERKASLSASELTLRAAVEVVARASGRPAAQCEFAGVPLLRIQDGSVQAKLLVVYARTCLAKDQAAQAAVDALAADADGHGTTQKAQTQTQTQHVAGNPLGRKGSSSHRQFLAYTIVTDDEAAAGRRPQEQPEAEAETLPPPHRPQYVPQYAPGDFIALQDFELQQDGSLTERRTASSGHSSSVGSKTTAASASAAAAAGASAAAEDAASRSSASSGRRTGAQVASAGPLAVGLDHELAASSVGSSLVLSVSDSGAHADVSTFDDLIALPAGPFGAKKTQEEEEETELMAQQQQTEEEQPSALEDARVAALFGAAPDVHGLLEGKRPSLVLTKKSMIDEIQEILDSLQMESQFERHSHVGVGTMPSPPQPHPLAKDAAHALTMDAVRCCCQCGKRSDGLADMALSGRDWYCQDCWEFFFFSEEREQQLDPSASMSGERGSMLDVDAASVDDDEEEDEEEAFKYSFHDSAFSRDDVLMMRLARPSPSRSPGLSLSPDSGPRDSALTTASSVTENGDEVWL